jgi:hypothetical protein
LVGATAPIVQAKLQNDENKAIRYSNNNTSAENVLSYRDYVLDSFAAKTYYFAKKHLGYSKQNAQNAAVKQCAVFNSKIKDSLKKIEVVTKSINNDAATEVYGTIHKEAASLGVDVADFYNFEHSTIPKVKDNFATIYEDEKIDSKTINDKVESIDYVLREKILPGSTFFLDSDMELTLKMIDSDELDTNINVKPVLNKSLNEIEEENEQQKKQAILTTLETYIGDRLTANSSFDISSILQPYGKIIGGLKVGDKVPKEEASQMFEYKYDATKGALLTAPNFDYRNATPQILKDGESIEYDSRFDFMKKKALTGYNTDDANLDALEIEPGYFIECKIYDFDVITDSHKCFISYQFGISSGDKDEKIVWSDISKDNPDRENSILKQEYEIKDFNYIKYISEHTYYSNVENANLSGYDKEHDEYFADTKSQRRKINEVLADQKIPDDEYDFKNKPIYLNKTDCEGITIPSIPGQENTDSMHTHQSLKMKVTDVNIDITKKDKHQCAFKMN